MKSLHPPFSVARLYIVISPSFAFADQVAPLVSTAKKILGEVEMVVVLPLPQLPGQFNSNWFPAQTISHHTKAVTFRTYSGAWVTTDSLSVAKRVSRLARPFGRVANRLRSKGFLALSRLFSFLEWASVEVNTSAHYSRQLTSEICTRPALAILDITEVRKPYFYELVCTLQDIPCISINHGIDIIEPSREPIRIPSGGEFDNLLSATVLLLQSRGEERHYLESFGERLPTTLKAGVPRHSPDWRTELGMNERPSPTDSARSILLISRPSGTTYLPLDRKLRALRMVRDLAVKYGFEITVKLHPKETDEKLYRRVLGSGRGKVKWRFSYKHVLALASPSTVVITFHSGVPLDLQLLGVSSIQLLNLEGLPEYEVPGGLRDSKGRPTNSYGHAGAVLVASDSQELENHVERILSEPSLVLKQISGSYDTEFFPPPDLYDLMVSAISESLTKRND